MENIMFITVCDVCGVQVARRSDTDILEDVEGTLSGTGGVAPTGTEHECDGWQVGTHNPKMPQFM